MDCPCWARDICVYGLNEGTPVARWNSGKADGHPDVLSWSGVGEGREILTPVVLCSADRPTVDLVLSRLAAECIGQGGRVFWMSSRSYAQPLAWLPLQESRLDLGGGQVSAPPLFDLPPEWCTGWLAYRWQITDRSALIALAEAVGFGYSFPSGTSMRDRWLAIRSRFVDQMQAIGQAVPAVAEIEGEGEGLASFGVASLNVVSGNARHWFAEADAALLHLLHFMSRASQVSGSVPMLVVVEGVWEALSPAQQTMLRPALIQFARSPQGSVLMQTPQPAEWLSSPDSRVLLESSLPLASPGSEFEWPECWPGTAPELLPGVRYDRLVAVPWLDSLCGPATPVAWRWLSVPSVDEVQVPGASMLDVETNTSSPD